MSLNIAKLLATLSQSARDQKLLAQGRLVSPGQMANLAALPAYPSGDPILKAP